MASLSFETLILHAQDATKTRLAALTICDNATDIDDARTLLQAVGIIPEPEAQPVNLFVPGMDNRRARRARAKARQETT